MIGRLKRSLNKKCPDCGKILQLRELNTEQLIDGEKVKVAKDYILCSNPDCGYEEVVEAKRIRRQEALA